MLNKITLNTEVIEMMLFYWESVVARDKVAEVYMIELANRPEMKPLYGDDFEVDSVRRVLSAIVNREILNGATKKELRFWNYNMWMTEDLEFMRSMVNPVKTMNLENIRKKYENTNKYDNIEVRFVPGHFDIYYIEDNVLTINFFCLATDFAGGFNIDGVPYMEFIEQKIGEMDK